MAACAALPMVGDFQQAQEARRDVYERAARGDMGPSVKGNNANALMTDATRRTVNNTPWVVGGVLVVAGALVWPRKN